MKDSQVNTDYSAMYLKWLKENIEQYKINDSTYRITLPFLDRNNDEADVYIISKGRGMYDITDDGETLNELDFNGFSFESSKKRKAILNSIVSSCGVSISDDNALTVSCTLSDLPAKKHMLAQCMIKVSDMFYLSRTNVQSLFIEDVKLFFDQNEVKYVPDVNITGKSKLQTHYDYIIARTNNYPERLISVINNMNLNSAKNAIFSWNDIRDTRYKNSKMITIFQDEELKVSEKAIDALEEYEIIPIGWSERFKHIDELTA